MSGKEELRTDEGVKGEVVEENAGRGRGAALLCQIGAWCLGETFQKKETKHR